MIRYDENIMFTGHNILLVLLYTMLSDNTPQEWNHRVALYGMGGVGKPKQQ